MKRLLLPLLAVALFGAGYAASKVQGPVMDRLSGPQERAEDPYGLLREDYHPNPVQAPCPKGDRVMVALILGQSNAASHGSRRTSTRNAVVFYQGRCYVASDPLLGSTGKGGSVWPAFADRIAQSGRYDAVILVPAAVGSSRMASWSPGGVLWPRVLERLGDLKAAGHAPTHILVQQGESEGNSHGDSDAYRLHTERFLQALAKTGAAVHMATASRCYGAPNEAIRSAQRGHALPGPDADALVSNDQRHEGCHYGEAGQRAMGEAWAEAVLRPAPTPAVARLSRPQP